MTGAMQPCLELIQITSDESTAAAKIAQRDMILNDACQGGAGPKSAYAVFEDAKDSRLILRLVLTATPKPDCMVYGCNPNLFVPHTMSLSTHTSGLVSCESTGVCP